MLRGKHIFVDILCLVAPQAFSCFVFEFMNVKMKMLGKGQFFFVVILKAMIRQSVL